MSLSNRVARCGVLLATLAVVALATAGCDRIGGPHAQAERLMKRGDFAGALQAYNDAIARGDHLTVAYANRCYVQQELDHDEEAVHDCSESLKLDPKQPEVLNNRGVSYLNLRKYDESRADFDAAIKLKPDYVEAYANRGKLYITREDFKGAIDDLTKVIGQKGASAAALSDAFGNRAMAYQSLGDGDKALADYTEAIKHGGDPQAYFNRGMLYLAMGYFDKSYDDFKIVADKGDKASDIYLMSKANLEFLQNRPKGFDPKAGVTVEPKAATARAAGTATSEALGTPTVTLSTAPAGMAEPTRAVTATLAVTP